MGTTFKAKLQALLQQYAADAGTTVEPREGADGFWVTHEGREYFVQATFQRVVGDKA